MSVRGYSQVLEHATIVSNNQNIPIGRECVQHLFLNRNGMTEIVHYCRENTEEGYREMSHEQFFIDAGRAAEILDAVSNCFYTRKSAPLKTLDENRSTWTVEMHPKYFNIEARCWGYYGDTCVIDEGDVSELIRTVLDRKELMLFDGGHAGRLWN